MNYIVFNSPIGEIKVVEDQEKIIEIKFVKDEKVINPETEILKLAKKELEEYFCGKRKNFTFPFKVDGSEFALKVYKALTEIPYGETCSYKDIARKIGITPKTFYEKMKIGVFGSDEIQIMIDELHIDNPIEIFFAEE